MLDHLFSRLTSSSQIEALFTAYDSVRRPRSQKVVDMARKFGRIYAYAEGDMHENPEMMRQFFKESTGYTNYVDLVGHHDRAMAMFEKNVDSAANGNTSLAESRTAT